MKVGKVLLDGLRGNFCLIVRDGRIEVMCHMGGSNFVMKEVDGAPWIEFVVGTVDGVESALDEVVVAIGEVWDINVSVLKPVIGNGWRTLIPVRKENG